MALESFYISTSTFISQPDEAILLPPPLECSPALPPHANADFNSSEEAKLHATSLFDRQYGDFTLLKKHMDKYAEDGQFILALNSREKINVTIGGQDAKIPCQQTI
jgi:hypothetical protein